MLISLTSLQRSHYYHLFHLATAIYGFVDLEFCNNVYKNFSNFVYDIVNKLYTIIMNYQSLS